MNSKSKFLLLHLLWLSIVLREVQAWSSPKVKNPDPKVLEEWVEGIQNSKNTDEAMLITKHFMDEMNFTNMSDSMLERQLEDVSCFTCYASVLTLRYIPLFLKDKLASAVKTVCTLFKKGKPEVCDGITDRYINELTHILRKTDFRFDEVCSFTFYDRCGDAYARNHNWEISIPPKTEPTISKERPISKEAAPILNVLHISDYHFDPYYKEGANAACDTPLCCRASSGLPADPESAAGKWGDYRKCDTPKILLDSMFEHISKTHKIDLVLWSGDIPPHDVWNQTKQGNLNIIKMAVEQMTEYFPNIPVFPALGNHESEPVNNFPPPPFVDGSNLTIDWLFKEITQLWKRWLTEETLTNVREGGFYSTLFRKGLRIISLNMNWCNSLNWWLLFSPTDPMNQLKWLVSELQKSELSNERVLIFGHIPPGYECNTVWSRNFNNIIARFEDIVIAQFYGHTHFDHFEVLHDPKNLSHATNVAYIGPSVTPYEDLNPGYRIFHIDADHHETKRAVVDHETWIMDLKHANSEPNNEPNWFKLYSAREAYGMKDLRPSDWDELIERMTNDEKVFEQFHKFYWKDSPVRPDCDSKCKKNLICSCKTGNTDDINKVC